MPPQVFHLSFSPLTAHAFNADRSRVAVCENSSDVTIYRRAGTAAGWEREATLTEHDKLVTSIDWAPKSDRLVTCSQDRNAYVWQEVQGKWEPTLVLLRINRAATMVRWSPNEDKFAVATGARVVAICSFEEDNDWWVAKHLKKPLRSTVLSIDWHPNNVLLATGSADMRTRVFSAFIKGVDKRPAPTVWGERLPFGTLCGEFATPAGGWVHGVAFSPTGDAVAFVGHDASLTVVYPSGPDSPPAAVHTLRFPTLPHVTLAFIREDALVAAGHGCQPILFEGSIDGWKASKTLDAAGALAGKAAPPPPPPKPSGLAGGPGRLNTAAFARFRAADAQGTPTPGSGGSATGGALRLGAVPGASVGSDGELHTTHQNSITSVRPYEGAPGDISSVSTSGVDGRLCVFPTNAGAPLAKAFQGLRI